MIKEINSEDFIDNVFSSNIPVIVYFWASWCSPCKKMSPLLEEISEEYKNKFSVLKVDVQKNADAAVDFKINSIPTILFFVDGKPINSVVGVISKIELEKHLQTVLA